MSDDFKYAIDERGSLVRGAELRFAYSGAGVATLVSRDGTGVKVREGARNLRAISGGDLILESDDASEPLAAEPGAAPPDADDGTAPEEPVERPGRTGRKAG